MPHHLLWWIWISSPNSRMFCWHLIKYFLRLLMCVLLCHVKWNSFFIILENSKFVFFFSNQTNSRHFVLISMHLSWWIWILSRNYRILTFKKKDNCEMFNVCSAPSCKMEFLFIILDISKGCFTNQTNSRHFVLTSMHLSW